MRIAYKLPIFLVAFTAAFGAAMMAFEAFIAVPGLDAIELDSARRDQNRILAALAREERQLSFTTRDWGQWDDCYRFVGGDNPGFVAANLDPGTFETTKVDIIAVYRGDGRLLFSGRGRPGGGGILPQSAFPARAAANAAYFRPARTGEDLTGILRAGGEAFVLASSPVLPSDGEGTPVGCLIMCRLVSDEMAAAVSEQTEVPLELSLAEGEPVAGFGRTVDGRSIAGVASIPDIEGSPALVARTETSRDIGTRGLATVRLFRDAILASCVLLTFALAAALSRLVSRPIAGIRKQILRMESGLALSMPDRLAGRRDEVGALARAFSELSARLAEKRRELEEAYESLEEKVEERTFELSLLAKVVEATSEAVVLTDMDGNIVKVNEAFCRVSGFAEEELLGENPRVMKSNRHDAAFYQAMWRSLIEKGTWSGEIWDRKKGGEIYPKWLTINRISDQRGQPRNYVGVSADITEIKATEEKLHHLAYYDPLTSLPNRSLFRDRLELSVARSARRGLSLGVVFIDLDRFKYVNDTMGHAAGDKLLIEVGRRFAGTLRGSDTVCRFSGDEFTLILEDIRSAEDAAKVAEHILDGISAPVILDGGSVFIGASLGIATFPVDDSTAEGLMRKADAAMYSAKESGRNRYRFASGETESANRERLELDLGLRRALDEAELLVYYQPIVDASGSSLLGAEALLRWKKPGSPEPCLPERCIALAEESGLILRIGEFVLREACRQAAAWRAASGLEDFRISVNVSARQFESAGLVGLIGEVLRESGLPPTALDIEITESALMADMGLALRTMQGLKSLGVTLSVDDFGTGYASLSYLSRFPVDRLKIDRSFIRDMEQSPASSALVDAILAIAGSLGVIALAEGVETEGQRRRLADKACSELQGYLFSKPLPPGGFAELFLAAAPNSPPPRAVLNRREEARA
jgi:diguanylate cyclase (GGDEF)-like protein/PAS domain S-box-containing protein